MSDSTPSVTGAEQPNTINSFIVADRIDDVLAFLHAVFDAEENLDARAPDMFAGDHTLIHAETRIGTSTILLFDRKTDWPFTPALTQVYVDNAHTTLQRALAHGATIITEVSPFYGGTDISRFLDPWHNLWWLFSPTPDDQTGAADWDESTWEAPDEPDTVYTTIVQAMQTLTDPRTTTSSRDDER